MINTDPNNDNCINRSPAYRAIALQAGAEHNM